MCASPKIRYYFGKKTKVYPDERSSVHSLGFFTYFFLSSLLLSSSTRRRFYPQRSSGQAVVTGVVPSPRYVPSNFIAHRVQHSHCSSIFIECCYLTLSRFPPINFYARKSPYEYVHSVRIELAKLIVVGTRISYQATGTRNVTSNTNILIV